MVHSISRHIVFEVPIGHLEEMSRSRWCHRSGAQEENLQWRRILESSVQVVSKAEK